MGTTVENLLPTLANLKRQEKLFIIQYLASDLSQDEGGFILKEMDYPVWSPLEANNAATVLLNLLEDTKLAFAWTKADGIPLLLGQTNFFMEFDVCFFRAKLFFEVKPKSV